MNNIMDNREELLQLITRFISLNLTEIPIELENYLVYVARTGDTIYNWPYLQYLLKAKLESVLKNFTKNTIVAADFNFDEMKSLCISGIERYYETPLTIQRIIQLLCEPQNHYGRIDYYMRALYKNISLGHTIEVANKKTKRFRQSLNYGVIMELQKKNVELPSVSSYSKHNDSTNSVFPPPIKKLKLLTENSDDDDEMHEYSRFFKPQYEYMNDNSNNNNDRFGHFLK